MNTLVVILFVFFLRWLLIVTALLRLLLGLRFWTVLIVHVHRWIADSRAARWRRPRVESRGCDGVAILVHEMQVSGEGLVGAL